MSDILKLDPRLITGDITINTPLFVLDYIAKFIKLIYKESYIGMENYHIEIVNAINEYNYVEIDLNQENEEETNLSRIMKFISPYSSSSEWLIESIIMGYDHMMSFSIEYDLPEYNLKEICIGNKTNESPYSLNQLIVYRIASYHNYTMNKNTSYDELTMFIERLALKKITSFKNSLLHTINSMNDIDLLKVYHLVGNLKTIDTNESNLEIQEVRDTPLVFDSFMFEMTLNNYFDRKQLICRLKAKTNYEAIIVAAIKYKINIIDSHYPLKELECLNKRTYIPYCQFFSKKYNSNKEYYNINKNWCENLSNSEIYTLQQMKEFVINEGFEKINTLSFNELNSYMKSTKNMFNFYFGKHISCKNTSTIMLTPLSELNNDELICFGIENKNDLYYISIDELNDYFSNMKMYVDPITNCMIDRRVINKLMLFCKNNNHVKLYRTIEDLNKMEKLLDMTSFKIKKNLQTYDNDTVEKLKKFFNNTMEMGLYMRGWKVNESIDFPLESEKTIYDESKSVPIDKVIDISIYGETGYTKKQCVMDNTAIALEKAMDSLNELPTELICDIKQLHILKFNKKDTAVEIMGCLFKGAKVYTQETLIDCLKSIYKGIENNESCMRTNSNWILYSSIWYMMVFGFEVPFKIDKIDDIF